MTLMSFPAVSTVRAEVSTGTSALAPAATRPCKGRSPPSTRGRKAMEREPSLDAGPGTTFTVMSTLLNSETAAPPPPEPWVDWNTSSNVMRCSPRGMGRSAECVAMILMVPMADGDTVMPEIGSAVAFSAPTGAGPAMKTSASTLKRSFTHDGEGWLALPTMSKKRWRTAAADSPPPPPAQAFTELTDTLPCRMAASSGCKEAVASKDLTVTCLTRVTVEPSGGAAMGLRAT